MKKKILLTLILAIFTFNILGVNIVAIAADEETNTWDVSKNGDGSVIATLDENGTMTIQGAGEMKNYSTIMSQPYNSIKNKIKEIEIQQGITSIGDNAFYNCSNLIEINIPNSVTSIGRNTLSGCSSLIEIKVASNNTNYMSENGILFNKSKTEIIRYPAKKEQNEYTIPNTVTSIGESVFFGCSSLTKINIPSTVTSIGKYAFTRCENLIEINVPDRVTNIQRGVFEYCTSLKKATMPKGVITIEEYAFRGCGSLTEVGIPNSVTSIIQEAFSGCRNLTDINIPEGTTYIGSEAFFGCNSLKEINVAKNNTKYMSENGILYNKEKTTILCYPAAKEEKEYTMPNSVTAIEKYAFYGCDKLTKINISSGVTSIGQGAFYKCGSLTKINIPSSVTSIEDNVFHGCSSLTEINIPSSVTSIGFYAFAYSRSLTKINIPSRVKSIKGGAFSGCSSLTKINIPSSVTSIGSGVFDGCSSLTEVNIPSSVISIGDSAFYGCKSLTAINIPEGVTSIGRATFSGCSSLIKINISRGITSIGDSAFFGCKSLTAINIPEGVKYIGNFVFTNCSSLKDIDIPDTVTSIGNSVFSSCSSLKDIDIPETVTSIGNSMFSNCYSLEKVKIPEKVTSIGDYAFFRCSSLAYINIPERVVSIGNNAFGECILTLAFDDSRELKLPEIIKRTMDERDILYSDKELTWTNCKISEDDKVIIDEGQQTASLKINGGSLKGFRLSLKQTGIITYSNTSWTNENVTATLNILKGETVTNNEGKNTYTFTKNGEFTFEYITKNGEKKTATAKVTNIDKTSPTINSVNLNTENWTNNNVTLTIDATDEESGIATYSLDGGKTWKVSNKITYTENKSGIEIQAKDNAGNIAIYSEKINIDKIDKKVPTIISVKGNPTEWTKDNATIVVEAEDYESGIATENGYSFDGGRTWQTSNKKIYTENKSGIEIQVKDNAGNIAIRSEKINIDKIDNAAPIIEDVKLSPNIWTKDSITLIIKASDKESKITGYSFDGGKTWQTENTKVYAKNENEIEIKVRDALGNIATYSEKINIDKIDKKAPTINKVTGNATDWIRNVILEVDAEDSESGISKENGYSFDGGRTWQTSKQKTYIENESNIEIQVKDKAGNITIYPDKINIDKIVKIGDVDNDGKIDFKDMLKINKHRLEKEKLTERDLFAADVNGDGVADFKDMLLINKFRLGKIISF